MKNKNWTPTQKYIADNIPNIKDFPIKGIQFKDATGLMVNPKAYRSVIDEIIGLARKYRFDVIVAPESRGFWFSLPVAYELKKSFVPVRKAGKLPRPTIGLEYTIEYGKAKIEIIKKDIKPGSRVLIIDDLLATGGTVAATIELIRRLHATPVAAIFVINLPDLPGKNCIEKLGVPVENIIDLPGK